MVHVGSFHSIVAGGLELLSYTTRLNLTDFVDVVAHLGQEIIRQVAPIRRHAVCAAHCTKRYSVLICLLIAHHSDTLYGQQNGPSLPHVVVQSCILEALNPVVVHLLSTRTFSAVMSPKMRIANPGPGKGCRSRMRSDVHCALHAAHFVFEQKAQWLDHFEFHVIRRPSRCGGF